MPPLLCPFGCQAALRQESEETVGQINSSYIRKQHLPIENGIRQVINLL